MPKSNQNNLWKFVCTSCTCCITFTPVSTAPAGNLTIFPSQKAEFLIYVQDFLKKLFIPSISPSLEPFPRARNPSMIVFSCSFVLLVSARSILQTSLTRFASVKFAEASSSPLSPPLPSICGLGNGMLSNRPVRAGGGLKALGSN